LKWSRARKQYERQGLLVESEALEKAEAECLKDAELRERRKEREAERRAMEDQNFINNFAAKIREIYPNCPSGNEFVIARHACKKYSDRVGRSVAAKKFDENAITLAVIAHIRHTMTDYDALLIKGVDRYGARKTVAVEIEKVIVDWK